MQNVLDSLKARYRLTILLVLGIGVLLLVSRFLLPRQGSRNKDYMELRSCRLHHVVKGTERDFPSLASLASEDSLKLHVGLSHGLDRIFRLDMDQDGYVEYRFSTWNKKEDSGGQEIVTVDFYKSSFKVDEDSLLVVRKALQKAEFEELEKEYHANMVDGQQLIIMVKTDSAEKSVYFNNHFPAEIKELYNTVRRETIGKHHGEIERGKVKVQEY